MPGSGELRWRVQFQRRALDGNNDRLGAFEDVFKSWAKVDWQRGSESAVSDRMEGKKPVIITVRRWKQTEAVTEGFRCSIEGSGAIPGEQFNITSVVPAREAGFLNILAFAGQATG